MIRPEGGSFRDPASRVLLAGTRVLRCFDDDAARTFHAAAAAGLLDDLERRGAVVGWHPVAAAEVQEVQALAPGAALVLEHPRVPFVSYPYEWPFAMLKAAALLTLEIQTAALAAGFTLKDATPYNVQFIGTRPVFIDLGSFERSRDGAPWAPYTQFCRLFLYPLLLEALRGVPYQPELRSSLEGLDAARLGRLLRPRDKLRPSVFRDVVLQGWLERWSGAGAGADRQTLASARVDRRALLRLLERLRDAISRLDSGVPDSAWSAYDLHDAYPAEARQLKERTIEALVRAAPRALVWDLGCNVGRFSVLAAQGSHCVVALDADPAVVNRLARAGSTNVLPLVVDVLNPSPDQGWAGTERLSLVRRGRPDLVLCLGLLHHLVVRGQVPLAEVVRWLAGLGGEVVVEFVPTEDPGFGQLVRWRTSPHHALSEQALETALAEHFGVVRRTPLAPSGRVLYTAAGR
jgi:SAM-dependent methyltransferase